MSYVAPKPESYLDEVVGDGQCVAFVKESAGCPATSRWAEGSKVRGAGLGIGTAIATFQDGKYNNYTDGRSHAAIYISQNDAGLVVYDQWKDHAVSKRLISFKGGNGKPSNDGDAFSVIESSTVIQGLNKISKKAVGKAIAGSQSKVKKEKKLNMNKMLVR